MQFLLLIGSPLARDWKLVKAARLNQWVARGENLDRAALDEAVRENFRSTAHSIFDLYHNINNPESFHNIIEIHPIAEQFLKRPEYSERGLVVAGLHMGSFDFIGQAAGICRSQRVLFGSAYGELGLSKADRDAQGKRDEHNPNQPRNVKTSYKVSATLEE